MQLGLHIHDEEAFRASARDRVIAGQHDAPSNCLDPELTSLSECCVMLLDPGCRPDGSRILWSGADELNSDF